MGSCISSTSNVDDDDEQMILVTAKLILMDGSIQEFSQGAKCNEILSRHPDHFICKSGGLYSGKHISEVLNHHDQLEVGELYFLLPYRKLEFVLTDSDMASLLLKANAAIQQGTKNCKKDKVQPLFDIHICGEEYSSSDVCCVPKPVACSAGNRRKQRRPSEMETILECSVQELL